MQQIQASEPSETPGLQAWNDPRGLRSSWRDQSLMTVALVSSATNCIRFGPFQRKGAISHFHDFIVLSVVM
jgi:hypothetical protein